MASTVDRIIECGVVAVLRADNPAVLMDVSKALRDGGVVAIEVTMTVPGALKVIEEASAKMTDTIIGVGSVLDPETARAAILSGAEYVVSPILNVSVIEMTKRYGKAIMPAGFTPTEILTAWQAGADVVKVFPAGVGGPSYFKDVLGPLPQVKMMPTGGVDATTTPQFIKNGAVAVGAGSAMIDKQAVADKDWAKLTATAKSFVDAVSEARASK
ncbi:MAG: bifunctional 4-hydroxy-2-oxoglutarate aldolase/2-dehydro-3-deoxy-phosphogluconate aldolase [Candidatus Latescibacteria bacterium]|jgi:2-dehydro-3-deoxyphosphogluconate aldolase / (4S)-4-hydroxy-2-oxoglutarate aldolase|nr:bifunctional 4-hydroxy-2-oxoglutarate aldolase/2-dehydro-3-deoxy-phosphogluconate aldolase [Candidatus Latescibacterota bacterium]MBT5832098.1 bifunctional 4-hydroxy-2-oxoglutarate aldolase/2-dehydro-3-deoxy-phosphogluconate aldolase [Candidatus Latescibacterota bacterium]